MYKTLVVVDQLDPAHPEAITFEQYLADYPKKAEPKTRVINLCNTEHYLSRGYYCSLLAEARQHRVLPSVETINDLRAREMPQGLAVTATLWVYFGRTPQTKWAALAKKAFDSFPAPLLKLTLYTQGSSTQFWATRASLDELNDSERAEFAAALHDFTAKVWRTPRKPRAYRWDMAILVDPDESHPPSDKRALEKCVKAAAKLGIHAELLTAEQLGSIAQYDALFIRQTTAIDHLTYRLAREAEHEGLVVIDDAQSILRCCNKVYLHDAFSYQNVPAPRTEVVLEATPERAEKLEASFGYPMVLKLPEGSFSRGVHKANNRKELLEYLTDMLVNSALVLVQEYLFTEFDWRIGVLAGKPLYACRYHMAKGHWQIYNHQSSDEASGHFDTLPTFEVPRAVLDAAIRATRLIGHGLYGVDIKQHGDQVVVIEVNDNPSLDNGVEDAYLGDELYMTLMAEFASRLEERGRPNRDT
ncbi:MAG: RimK family protein [Litorivicinus sp.]